jgi:hypothetical protein
MVGHRRRAAARTWPLCGIVQPDRGTLRTAACPFRGTHGHHRADTVVVVVDRTRALAVDAKAARERDTVVVWLVGCLGLIGIGLMLMLDLLVFQAF